MFYPILTYSIRRKNEKNQTDRAIFQVIRKMSCLLAIQPGTRNEVFARQIVHARAKQIGVTYLSVNAISDIVREDVANFNWDTKPLESSGNWKFRAFIFELLERVITLTSFCLEKVEKKG
jgi:KaiC/GvpD/RAD55 family RecA-like ATPase